MPELPEVEHLRRRLTRLVRGARIEQALVLRDDILARGARRPKPNEQLTKDAPSSNQSTRTTDRGGATAIADLLRGRTLIDFGRHGKLLLARLDDGGWLLLHLGMSGQVLVADDEDLLQRTDHLHMLLRLQRADGRPAVLAFRDPRRFGGIQHAIPNSSRTTTRAPLPAPWDAFGPDAWTGRPALLAPSMRRLASGLSASFWAERCGVGRRPIKASLLDQHRIAGLGNIYVDEILHRAGIRPSTPCQRLRREAWERVAAAAHSILRSAISAGGSTIRDYADVENRPGTFARRHAVYGRADQPCVSCGRPLRGESIAGRMSVYCPRCQTSCQLRSR